MERVSLKMNIYLITNLINNKQYIGAEKNGNNPNYFGSGKLIIEAIKEFGKKNFKKDIIIDDEYIDNWEECLELESLCISLLNTLKHSGYNQQIYSWPPSIEMCIKGGKIGGKISGKQNKELKVGLFDPTNEKRVKEGNRKGSEVAAKRNKKLEIGLFDPTNKEKIRENSSKVGRKNVELKRGWFAPGATSKAGKRAYELKRGVFAPENLGKGGKNKAHILFEIDGILQRTTLGAILRA